MRMPERPPEPAARWGAEDRARARARAEARPATRGARLADSVGVVGAVLAALCCAGTPFIVAGLAAVGLSFLRRDAILWPLMLGSLLVALWGFWRGARVHGRSGPLWLGAMGAVSLAAGVIVVHGPPAMPMIYGGAAALVAATVWNRVARRARARRPWGAVRR
jgi:mercuric ion transport protein